MQKEQDVEALRAVAIILVIALHVMNDPAASSARVFYEHVSFSAQNVRLPLFTVISGYLYAARPVISGGTSAFLRGKIRRILIPLATVSTLEFLAVAAMGRGERSSEVSDIWRIFIFPYETYWFLQALFLIFVTVALVDQRVDSRKFGSWALGALVASAIHLGYPLLAIQPDLFSLRGASYLLPFFVVGVGINRHRDVLCSERALAIALVIAATGLILQELSYANPASRALTGHGSFIGLMLGSTACLLLLNLHLRSRALASIGSHAYTIYLFQSFGAGIGRRSLASLGLNPHFYVVGVIAVTLAFGISVERVAERLPYVRTLLLGRPWGLSRSKAAGGQRAG